MPALRESVRRLGWAPRRSVGGTQIAQQRMPEFGDGPEVGGDRVRRKTSGGQFKRPLIENRQLRTGRGRHWFRDCSGVKALGA
jgi:hypothetical protein